MSKLLIIALAAWIMFFGGYTTLKNITAKNDLSKVPQTIVNGANKVAAGNTGQPLSIPAVSPASGKVVIDSPGAAVQPKEQPTTETQPTTAPTAVVVVVQELPQAAKAPTATPLPTTAPAIDISNEQYSLRKVTDGLEQHWCVYIYGNDHDIRVCWAPGDRPDDSNVDFVVRAVKLGQIQGEVVNEQ